jgi:hypothetical protein
MQFREDWAVSPNYTVEKLRRGSLQDKIDVFEDQIQGWILDYAKQLSSEQHAGIAILSLVVPYIEAFACYRLGEEPARGKSVEWFRCGLVEIFPRLQSGVSERFGENTEAVVRKITGTVYHELRCGLFHIGMIRGMVVVEPHPFSELEFAIDSGSEEVLCITIDPFRFLVRILDHFREYVAELRDPANTETRKNFEKFWDLRVGGPAPLASSIEVLNRSTILGTNTRLGA